MGMRTAMIEQKFDEIVEFSGISEFLDTPVKRYSSGMNARLGFSIAAHLDPDVLIIDEVLAVGDLPLPAKGLRPTPGARAERTAGHRRVASTGPDCRSLLEVDSARLGAGPRHRFPRRVHRRVFRTSQHRYPHGPGTSRVSRSERQPGRTTVRRQSIHIYGSRCQASEPPGRPDYRCPRALAGRDDFSLWNDSAAPEHPDTVGETSSRFAQSSGHISCRAATSWTPSP